MAILIMSLRIAMVVVDEQLRIIKAGAAEMFSKTKTKS